MMNKEQEKIYEIKWYEGLIGVVVISILFVLLLYYFTFGNRKLSTSPEQWGQFGDYIGGVLNPIFACATFIALLYTIKLQLDTIKLQKDSIKLQVEELKATREELSRSAKAQEESEKLLAEQSKIFKQQQFETTFFSMLNQLNQLCSKILNKEVEAFDEYLGKYVKKEFVDYIIDDLMNKGMYHFEDDNDLIRYYEKGDINFPEFKYIQKRVDKDFIEFNQFSLYLYQVLKFVNSLSYGNGNLDDEEKKYSNIVRASVDFRLLQLLAITAYREDTESYQPYIKILERYSFFEHMPLKLLANRNFNKLLIKCHRLYDPNIFGKSDYIKDIEKLIKRT